MAYSWKFSVSTAESQNWSGANVAHNPLAPPPAESSKNLIRARTTIWRMALLEHVQRSAWCPAHPCHSTVAPDLLPAEKSPSTAYSRRTPIYLLYLPSVLDTAQSERIPEDFILSRELVSIFVPGAAMSSWRARQAMQVDPLNRELAAG